MKRIGKQNQINGEQQRLRKSIPFKLSSILKASNRMEEKVTLAQVSQKFQFDKLNCAKRPNTPLIKTNSQKNKNSVLFLKNTRPSIHEDTQKLKHCQSSLLKISKQQSYQECIEERNQEVIEAKLFDLISLIHEDNKKPLNRCQSSSSLFFKSSKAPLILNQKRKNEEIFLPQPTFSQYCYKNEVNQIFTEFQSQGNTEKDLRQNQQNESYLVKSAYYKVPANSKIEKRMSHYIPNKKSQKQQYILCINCENYVNKSLTLQHEKQCVGFSRILKMKNDQLIDFLDEKINKKLNQLRQIERSLNSPIYKNQKAKAPCNLSLYQEKKRIDKILTDLDLIRLKALKRFHLKTVPV